MKHWLISLCLWFVKPKYDVDQDKGTTTKYKVLFGKVYHLETWVNPPVSWNCRCQIVPKT